MRWFHFSKYTPEALAEIRAAGFAERERHGREGSALLGAELIAISWTLGGEWDVISLYETDDIDLALWHETGSMVAASGAYERSEVMFAVSSEEADEAMTRNPLTAMLSPDS